VTILGPTNLAASAPFHASQLYARNLTAFLLHHLRDGALRLDTEDEITRETLVAQGGEIVHPRVREALGLGELAGKPPAADAAPAAAGSTVTSAGGSGREGV
jgi:NAD(P) transhydrogenase subunit alpha